MSKHVTKLSPMLSFMRIVKMLLIFMGAYVVSVRLDIHVASYIEWVYLAAVSFAIIFALDLVLSLIFETKDVKNLFIRIKSMVKRG